MARAACRDDPEIFFPAKNDSAAATKAQIMCFTCPVRPECNDWQELSDSRYGIWAGKHQNPKKETGSK